MSANGSQKYGGIFGGIARPSPLRYPHNMPLTALAVQRAAPSKKSFKLADSGGLYLLVQPTGSRLWRMNYRFGGRYKTLALGKFPAVGLAEARQARDNAKRKLRDRIDPSAERRKQKVASRIAADHSFRAVAESYQKKRSQEQTGPAGLRKDRESLAHALVGFGHRPISEIKPQEVLAVAKSIEERGKAAQRYRSTVSRVFRFAIANGLAEFDPAAPLVDALISRPVKHHPSPKDAKQIGALMRAIDGYEGEKLTRYALLIGTHAFVRPRELRTAEWAEVDTALRLWRIPAEKMKMRRDLIVPMSRQVTGWFESARLLSGGGRWVFPSILGSGRTMSDGTVNAALRRLGYPSSVIVGHGFRSMASTILNETGQFNPDWIERQLAHIDTNKVRGTYNAAQYLPQRTDMMQWYSDWLDRQAAGASYTSSPS